MSRRAPLQRALFGPGRILEYEGHRLARARAVVLGRGQLDGGPHLLAVYVVFPRERQEHAHRQRLPPQLIAHRGQQLLGLAALVQLGVLLRDDVEDDHRLFVVPPLHLVLGEF